MDMGKIARKERDSLLKERPKLKRFQKEINRRLQKAGSFENRMGVLGIMIAGKLTELQQQLSHLLSQIQLIDSWPTNLDRIYIVTQWIETFS